MMKFNAFGDEVTVIAGNATEIKAVYKSICRAEYTNLHPVFSDFPKFNPNRMYGIDISNNTGAFSIIGEPVLFDYMEAAGV